MKRFCLAVPLAAAVLLGGCSGGDTVAHLDGHPVSLEEYRQYAYDSISLVSAEYNRTYGADPNAADFWTTAYDGTTPLQTLLENADEAMRQAKGVQAAAVELGLLTEEQISWEGQQEAFETENRTRLETLEAGGIVYGPEQLTLAQFCSYWQSAVQQQVEDLLYQNAQPTEQQLRDYYDQHAAELSARNFTAEADFYYWPAGESDTAAQELVQILAQGTQQQAAVDELAARTGLKTGWRQETVNTREMGKEDQAYTQTVQLLADCALDEVTGPLYAEGMEVWIVPRSRQNEEIGSFEEAQAEIEDLWRTEEAQNQLQQMLDGQSWETTALHDKLTIEQIRPQQ